jgi:hypothetical protein
LPSSASVILVKNRVFPSDVVIRVLLVVDVHDNVGSGSPSAVQFRVLSFVRLTEKLGVTATKAGATEIWIEN